VHLVGSLKLAVVLLLSLAVAIAAATVLETGQGRASALWYVYHSRWFVTLLGLLGLNIACAALSRWPWKRHHTGFVITHGGLLVLLAGSIQSFLGGIEGRVTVRVGETTTKMTLPDQSQITAVWTDRLEEPPYEFVFSPGPVDWPASRPLRLGEVDGVSATVLRYYHQARVVEDWVPDDSGAGGPLVKLAIEDVEGNQGSERSLVDQECGDEAVIGPVQVRLRRAPWDVMLQDFLNPPASIPGKKGLLIAYYNERAVRVEVDQQKGQKVPLDDRGATLEIVRYLANARPDAHGHFESKGDEPLNPILEVRIVVPGQKEPYRQLTFAKSPLLTLDPVYGRVCPVALAYQHPAVQPGTTVEFLQTSNGRLYSRAFARGRLLESGPVKPGQSFRLSDKMSLVLTDHFPHTRENVYFEPAAAEENQAEKPEAAAEVLLSAGGVTQTVWVQRNHPNFGTRTIATPEGPIQVRFEDAYAPLGFSLSLQDFRREKNPGGLGNASFASRVRITDSDGTESEREISMNRPLTHQRLTLYQSGFNEGGQGAESSTFSVAYDPGRVLKYAGSLLICLGIAVMFYMRAYFFRKRPERSATAEEPALSTAATSIELVSAGVGSKPGAKIPEGSELFRREER
jgi:hypothetical protein